MQKVKLIIRKCVPSLCGLIHREAETFLLINTSALGILGAEGVSPWFSDLVKSDVKPVHLQKPFQPDAIQDIA